MKNIDEIILDYVVGENLSEGERHELDVWLRERRNSRLVEVLKKMSEERELRQALSLHKEEGMRMIREKIRKRNRRMRLRYACSAAACVLLLAGAFFLWDLRENKPVEQPVGLSSLWMESDHAGVRLELGDGNVVSLEDCGDEMVVADSLHHVRNENNTLVYSGESRLEDSLVFNTLIVPLGAEYRLVLADGTRV